MVKYIITMCILANTEYISVQCAECLLSPYKINEFSQFYYCHTRFDNNLRLMPAFKLIQLIFGAQKCFDNK